MIDSKIIAAFHYARQHGASAAAAIISARFDVANNVARYPASPQDPARLSRAPVKRDSVFIDTPESAGFRFVDYADKLASLNHTGWYTDDEFQDSTLRGAVLQLPARKGCARFVAAYQESDNDGYVIDLSRGAVYSEKVTYRHRDSCLDDEIRSAALNADSFAERAAEREREYQSAWRAGSNFAQLGESIIAARREALAILAERRDVRTMDKPALCKAIRARVDALLETIRDARREREELASNNYMARFFVDAFNEGALETVFA